jgi:hypothetical protein
VVLVRRRRPAAWRLSAVLVAVLLAGGATGCGVRSESEPRPIATQDVPYGLLEAAPATTSTTVRGPIVSVSVYFMQGERLAPVSRTVSQPATVGKAIEALLDGIREDEAILGLRTAINPRTQLLVARTEEGVARVNLSAAFAQGPVQQQIPSLAQVVFTATAIPGVGSVRFTLEGEPVEVPTPDGRTAVGPLGRDDFASLAPLAG